MMPAAVSAAITEHEGALIVQWDDGTRGEFPSIWLRDNLPQDRDRHSGQRLIDVTELPPEPRIRSVSLAGKDLCIDWQDEPQVATIELDWLYRQTGERSRGVGARRVRTWLQGARLDARGDFAWLTLSDLKSEASRRLQWLTRLEADGIAFLSEVPQVDSGVLDATGIVGHVAPTNYGLVFDVRAVPQPENLAYSDLGLGLHTDNPYREPVPGYQALHTLLAAPDGGDSLFADGFALAAHLRQIEPAFFETLTHTLVPFRYQSQQADLYAERPLIALDCAGAVVAVHYNSRSIAPVNLPVDECRRFYAAYRRFGELLREPRFQLTTRLGDGDLVLFDNQRILHGRTGFASARHARHLRGCYLTRDSVQSETALLRRRAANGASA
jgi:alpha-ketoglutarate-dependent taurine dioxygenase